MTKQLQLKKRNVYHLFIKATNEHFYYRSSILLAQIHYPVSPSAQYLKAYLSKVDFYESKRVIIRRGELLQKTFKRLPNNKKKVTKE